MDFGCAGSARPSGGEFRFSLAEGHENEVWYYDEFFSIEQYADGAWGPLPVQGGFCGVTSYWKIGEDPETDCLNIVWDSIYETLQPGIYCVSKEVFPEGAERRAGSGKWKAGICGVRDRRSDGAESGDPGRDADGPYHAVCEKGTGILQASLSTEKNTGWNDWRMDAGCVWMET